MTEFTPNDFIEYKKYLNSISVVLNKYFEDQKEYICCKKGCFHCCEYGAYPFSELEYKFMIIGFMTLDTNSKLEILHNIKLLKDQYHNLGNKENFYHTCPFLKRNKECSIYEYRGIICRTFGLITQLKDGTFTLPFCCDLDLNYSKVYNSKTKKIDYKKVQEYGYKVKPNAYRTSLGTIMSEEIFKEDPINFGEIKPLIEWL